MDWSLLGQGTLVTGSAITAIDTPAATNTKGPWTTVASTAFDCRVTPHLRAVGLYFGTELLFDLAYGDVGSENIIAHNIQFSSGTQAELGSDFPLNVRVGSGQRIAMRTQSTNRYAAWFNVQLTALGGFADMGWPTKAYGYGADTSDSGGTVVDPGGTASTWGSWTPLVAATSGHCKGFFVTFGSRGNQAMTSYAVHYFCIGVGGSGNEKVIAEYIARQTHSNHNLLLPRCTEVFWIPIPDGTRVSARAMCSITDATDRLVDITVVGLK